MDRSQQFDEAPARRLLSMSNPCRRQSTVGRAGGVSDGNARGPALDLVGDSLRISRDAVDHRRRERMQEVQADEVQPWFVGGDPALMARLAIWFENRQLDP